MQGGEGGLGKPPRVQRRGHAGVVAASAGWGMRLLLRLLLWLGLSLVLTAPVARVAGAVAVLAPVARAVALRWVSPRLVPPAWRKCARKWNLGRCGFAGLDVEPWSWVRGGPAPSVSGGRWSCGAIAWSGGGVVRGNVTGWSCVPAGWCVAVATCRVHGDDWCGRRERDLREWDWG